MKYMVSCDISDLQLWVIWDPEASGDAAAGARMPLAEDFKSCRELCRLMDRWPERWDLRLTLLGMRQLLVHCWSRVDQIISGHAMHPAVQASVNTECRGWIDKLDQLAAEVGLSRSRLGHLFSEQLGISLRTYRSRCLLQAFDAQRWKIQTLI